MRREREREGEGERKKMRRSGFLLLSQQFP